MQELRDEKDKQIEALQFQIKELKSLNSGTVSTITSQTGYLKQNVPNPGNSSPGISYYVPNNSRTAQIMITDINGRLIKVINASKGEGQVLYIPVNLQQELTCRPCT